MSRTGTFRVRAFTRKLRSSVSKTTSLFRRTGPSDGKYKNHFWKCTQENLFKKSCLNTEHTSSKTDFFSQSQPEFSEMFASLVKGNAFLFLTFLSRHKVLSIVSTVMQAAGQNYIIIVSLEIKNGQESLAYIKSFIQVSSIGTTKNTHRTEYKN